MKLVKLPKPVVFIAGLLCGILLLLICRQIPWNELFSKKKPVAALLKPQSDPAKNFYLPLNDRINAKIRFYLRPGQKANLLTGVQRSGQYLPFIINIFREYELPLSLVYLPIIESNFKSDMVSHAGAAGLWQIMPTTAQDYGLQQNRWIDERRDPEKSTIAAAEFLRFLYDELHNWDLVLAAYNSGLAAIKGAVRREFTSNFWQLAGIPEETYHFVPSFYAILHLLADPAEYRLDLTEISSPVDYETIQLEALYSLDAIAQLANVPTLILKMYNPAIISDIAPSGNYPIRLPIGRRDYFLEQVKLHPPQPVQVAYSTYRVKRGETLYKIAQKLGVPVSSLQAENNLYSARQLKPGQILKIAVVGTVDDYPQVVMTGKAPNPLLVTDALKRCKFVYSVTRDSISINTLARYYGVKKEEIKEWNPWIKTDWIQRNSQTVIYKPADRITIHKSKRGDTIWELARRHHTTVAHIKMWNQLAHAQIYPGQQLIVKLF